MANTVYMSKTGLIGGEATKLDSIDGAGLVDNDAAFVNVANVQYIYRLDADSAAAESSPNIIAPDTNPGDKRWILQSTLSPAPDIGAATGTSLTLSGLTASLPIFTDGSKKLVSKSVADTLTALGVGEWTDYGGTSTVTGWSGVGLAKTIYYKIIEKICFVDFAINGISDSTSASFTLPNNAGRSINTPAFTGYDLGTGYTSTIVGYLDSGSSQVVLMLGGSSTGWTGGAPGKRVSGQFFYPIA